MMILLTLLLLAQSGSTSTPVLVRDLKVDWMVATESGYSPVAPSALADVKTIYFHVDASNLKGHYISFSCQTEWEAFINGKLVFSGINRSFRLDSLAEKFSHQLFFGVHVAKGVRSLTTHVMVDMTPVAMDTPAIGTRPPTFFRDYCILVSSFLILFLLLLFRTNPQLTLDYFSFAKIFSTSERNENQVASRITSSVNLLFYLFCAALTGFLLSAIFYSSGPTLEAGRTIQITSLASALLVWTKLSLFILILLASKLLIVLLFSTLFNFRETISFQFFNFLRFILFTAVVMSILSLVYFTIRGREPVFYERLIVLALFLLSIGSVTVLIKLLARASFTFFHLFSYLCVSEIIPLENIIKIFF